MLIISYARFLSYLKKLYVFSMIFSRRQDEQEQVAQTAARQLQRYGDVTVTAIQSVTHAVSTTNYTM